MPNFTKIRFVVMAQRLKFLLVVLTVAYSCTVTVGCTPRQIVSPVKPTIEIARVMGITSCALTLALYAIQHRRISMR